MQRDDYGLVSWNGYEMTILTNDPDRVLPNAACPTCTYPIQFLMTTIGPWDGHEKGDRYFTVNFEVTITAACQLSPIIRTEDLIDMSTPIFGNVYQYDLQDRFTHQYVDVWLPNICLLQFRITGGDTTYLSMTKTIPASGFHHTLHEYTNLSSDVGTYSVTLEAYYVTWVDYAQPTQFLTSNQFTVVVEPICEITSFKNNPLISTTLNHYYSIYDAMFSWDFEILYEPPECNYIQFYTIAIDGEEQTSETWISISQATYPHKIQIYSGNAADKGIYAVSVSSHLNTTPAYASEDAYQFVVTLENDPCSQIVFDNQNIGPLYFEIAPGVAASGPIYFSDFTNDSGLYSCGARKYEVVQSHPGLTSNMAVKSFSFQTTDPWDVGTHEILFIVELVDYPQFNAIIYHLQAFEVIVTAACVTSDMQYVAPTEFQHKVGSVPSTYQFTPLMDEVSLRLGGDGVTYCGPRTYVDVALSSVEHASPDPVIADLIGPDVYSFENAQELNAHWGHYSITFGILLDYYPDFVQSDKSFDLHVFPDCEQSFIEQLNVIIFDPLVAGMTSTVDFSGFFSHDYYGYYNDYCGPLAYSLDPSPCDHFCLSGTVLTLDSESNHAGGVFSHNFKVYLQDHPSIELDIPMTVEIISCTIIGHYTDTLEALAVVPGQTDATHEITYSIGSLSIPVPFTFDEILSSQGDACGAAYDQVYSIHIIGLGCDLQPCNGANCPVASPDVDCTTSLPVWISQFDPSVASFTIGTIDYLFVRQSVNCQQWDISGQCIQANYGMIVRSVLMIDPPTGRDADTEIYFDLTFNFDPCLDTVLSPIPVYDMTFDMVVQQVDPLTQVYPAVTDTVGACGDIKYEVTGFLVDEGVIWLTPALHQISVWTEEGGYIGTHTVQLAVTLVDYPLLDSQVGLYYDIQVLIKSDCSSANLLAPSNTMYEYYQWDQQYYSQPHRIDREMKSQIAFQVQDSVSLGLTSLCGPRVYKYAFTDPSSPISGTARKIEIIRSETGPEAVLNFWETSQITQNEKQIVTVTAHLERFPLLVAEVSFDVTLFFIKNCRDQVIQSGLKDGIYEFSRSYFLVNVVGGGPQQTLFNYYLIECDLFFKGHEIDDLYNSQICGSIQIEMYEGVMIKDTGKTLSLEYLPKNQNTNCIVIPSMRDSQPLMTHQTNDIAYDGKKLYFKTYLYLLGDLEFPDYFLTSQNAAVDYKIRPYLDVRLEFISQSIIATNAAPVIVPHPGNKCQEQNILIIPYGQIDSMYLQAIDADNDLLYAALVATDLELEEENTSEQAQKCITNRRLHSSRRDLSAAENFVPWEICPGCISRNSDPITEGSFLQKITFTNLFDERNCKFYKQEFGVSDRKEITSFSLTLAFIPSNIPELTQALEANPCPTAFELEEACDTGVYDLAVQVEAPQEQEIEAEEVFAEPEVEEEDSTDCSQALELLNTINFNNVNALNTMLRKLDACSFPIPIIMQVTPDAEVHIDFTKPIRVLEQEELADQVQYLIDEEVIELQLLSVQGSGEVRIGQAYYDPSYFMNAGGEEQSSRDLQQILKRRDLESGEDFYNKNFRWTITKLTPTRMNLKLDFEEPVHISADSLEQDRMNVKFKNVNRLLIGEKDEAFKGPDNLDSLITQNKQVPRQSELDLSEAAGVVAGLAQGLVSLAVVGMSNFGLQSLWGAMNSLQLIVHMPLNNMVFPEPAQGLFESLINVVTFDILEQFDAVGFGLEYEVSPTASYNNGFEALGYDSAEPIGLLGTINFIMAIVLVQGLRHFYPRQFYFAYKIRSKQTGDQWVNGLIRFLIQIYFELLICVGAVFWFRHSSDSEVTDTLDEEDGASVDGNLRLIDYDYDELLSLDVFCIWYTVGIALLSLSFLIFACYTILKRNRKSLSLNKELKALTRDQKILDFQDQTKILVGQRYGYKPREAKTSAYEQVLVKTKLRLDLQESRTKRQKKINKINKKLDLENYKLLYVNEFFLGLMPHSRSAQFSNLVFLFRRILLVLIALVMDRTPQLQVMSMMLLCLANQIFLANEQVFADRSAYLNELVNDFVVLVGAIHAFVILSLDTNPEAQKATAISLSLLILGNLGIISILIFGMMLIQLRLKLINMATEHARKAEDWDRDWNRIKKRCSTSSSGKQSVTCSCNCTTCGQLQQATSLQKSQGSGSNLLQSSKMLIKSRAGDQQSTKQQNNLGREAVPSILANQQSCYIGDERQDALNHNSTVTGKSQSQDVEAPSSTFLNPQESNQLLHQEYKSNSSRSSQRFLNDQKNQLGKCPTSTPSPFVLISENQVTPIESCGDNNDSHSSSLSDDGRSQLSELGPRRPRMAVFDRPKGQAGENTSQINSAKEGFNGRIEQEQQVVGKHRPWWYDEEIFEIAEDSLEQKSETSSSNDEVEEVRPKEEAKRVVKEVNWGENMPKSNASTERFSRNEEIQSFGQQIGDRRNEILSQYKQ